MHNNSIAFALARITIGMSFFGHGLVRLPKLDKFSQWMVGSFQKSMLPEALVTPFSYILPVAEFIIGILLLLGLLTRFSLIAGTITMIALIFGSSMIEEWSAIPSQLLHAAFCILLLLFVQSWNGFSVDNVIRKKHT